MMSGLRHRPVWAQAFAIAAVAIALVLRLLADRWLPPGFPYLTFFPAVILSAYFAGLYAGITAAVLAGLAAWYFFIPPLHSFSVSPGGALALGFYAFIVSVDIAIIHIMITALEHLEAERRHSAALTERTRVMFAEMQHRISNNLQLISSLLSIQEARVSDPAALRALEVARSRVATLGRLHRALHNPAAQSVDMGAYLREMARDILDVSGAAHVSCRVAADPVPVPAEKVVPLALIAAELISNSLEHGFAGGRAGRLSIGLHLDDSGACTLVVRDDGPGLPPGFDLDTQNSLGLQIARSLAGQLNGQLSMHSDNGAVSTLVFRP